MHLSGSEDYFGVTFDELFCRCCEAVRRLGPIEVRRQGDTRKQWYENDPEVSSADWTHDFRVAFSSDTKRALAVRNTSSQNNRPHAPAAPADTSSFPQ